MSVATATGGALVSCDGVSVVHGHGDAAVRALAGVHIEIREARAWHAGAVRLRQDDPAPRPGWIDLPRLRGRLVARRRDDEPRPAARGGVRRRASPTSSRGQPAAQPRRRREHRLRAPGYRHARASRGSPHSGRPRGEGASPSRGPLRRGAAEGRDRQALAQRPQLLLCDEPTGHLDSDTGSRVLDLIEAARELLGFAMVMATHDPGVARRADRILELRDGLLRAGEDA